MKKIIPYISCGLGMLFLSACGSAPVTKPVIVQVPNESLSGDNSPAASEASQSSASALPEESTNSPAAQNSAQTTSVPIPSNAEVLVNEADQANPDEAEAATASSRALPENLAPEMVALVESLKLPKDFPLELLLLDSTVASMSSTPKSETKTTILVTSTSEKSALISTYRQLLKTLDAQNVSEATQGDNWGAIGEINEKSIAIVISPDPNTPSITLIEISVSK